MSSEPPADDTSAAPDVPPRPFGESPRELPVPRQGCSRMALAGCAVVLLLIGLGVLTLMLKARDVVAWSLGRVQVEIERVLPDDLAPAERRRLETAFDAAERHLEEGELDAPAFQDLQRQLLFFAGLQREPTSEEIAELAAALEQFAGAPTSEARPDPDPVPE